MYAIGTVHSQLALLRALQMDEPAQALFAAVQQWPLDWEFRRVIPEVVLTSPNVPHEAIEMLEWYLRYDPASVDTRIGLIGFQLATGKFLEANANYEIVKAIAPRSSYVQRVEAVLVSMKAASERSPSPPEPQSIH